MFRFFIGLWFLFFLVGCNLLNIPNVIDIYNKEFILISTSDNNKSKVQLVFNKKNQVSGFLGCNRLMGQVNFGESGAIDFSNTAVTKMFCSNMESEIEFLQTLHEITSYKIIEDRLLFKDKDSSIRLVFQVVR